MTVFASDDFENFPTGWTNSVSGAGTITKSAVQKHGGSYSCRIYSLGNNDQAEGWMSFTRIGTVNHHIRIWVYVDSSTIIDNDIYVMEVYDTVAGKGSSFGRIQYHDGAYYFRSQNAVGNDNICIVSPNVWHQIDAYYNYTTGKIHYYVDGVKQGGDWDSVSGAGVRPNIIYIGDVTNNAPFVTDGYIYLDDMIIDDAIEITTYTRPYSIDTLIKKLGLSRTDSIDVLFGKLNIEKTASIDTMFGKFGITDAYIIDVIVSLLAKSNSIDVLFKKLGITATESIDVLLKKLGIETVSNIDVMFEKLDIEKTDSVDVLFKKLEIMDSSPIDTLLLKLGITETDLTDVMFKKLDITKTDSVDVLLKKFGVTKTYITDIALKKYGLSVTTPLDVIFGIGFTQIGRMNAVKHALMTKLLEVDPTFTVIDAWRMGTWQFSSFNGVLVSVKMNPSRLLKLNYGNEIVNMHEGVYFLYHFSLHILARYDFTREDELESITAYNKANAIATYLRANNKDPDSGIVDIVQLTARESDPSGGTTAGAHMARIILEGFILAERPFRLRS